MGDYKQSFIKRINTIYQNSYSKISDIASFPARVAREILTEILVTGCKSQNISNILSARELADKLPEDWLVLNLPAVVQEELFLEQEWRSWEFLRAKEMFQNHPNVLKWLFSYAKNLHDTEIDEIISDDNEPSP